MGFKLVRIFLYVLACNFMGLLGVRVCVAFLSPENHVIGAIGMAFLGWLLLTVAFYKDNVKYKHLLEEEDDN